jgi:hypothetical protein
MQINKMLPNASFIWYDNLFLVFLESYMWYLRTTNPQIRIITEHQSFKYEGDLYGLLADMNIDHKYHYLVMRVNGFSASDEYDGVRTSLLTPDFNEVDILASLYRTQLN